MIKSPIKLSPRDKRAIAHLLNEFNELKPVILATVQGIARRNNLDWGNKWHLIAILAALFERYKAR